MRLERGPAASSSASLSHLPALLLIWELGHQRTARTAGKGASSPRGFDYGDARGVLGSEEQKVVRPLGRGKSGRARSERARGREGARRGQLT